MRLLCIDTCIIRQYMLQYKKSQRGYWTINAKAGGKIVINAGTFNCATPKWTLNLHDTQRGEIVVKGGTFYKFNPAISYGEPDAPVNFVAEGYKSIQEGDYYIVKQ